ncbi:MAG: enoyl-CoA hydratase/isomerase family protein [Chloroflexota bacterium]
MAYTTLLVETKGASGVITLSRPERLNAMNQALNNELETAVAEFEQDDAVRVIILTGTGEKAFSAGGDIHEMVEAKNQVIQPSEKRMEANWRLATCRKPTIGAMNGLAFGGGALLASLVDFRIGCEHTSFRFLAASYGRINATWTLPLIVGMPMAKELLFTGRLVGADEALRIGLLNRLVPASELMKTVLTIGEQIAANNDLAVQGIKALLSEDVGLSLREMMLAENEVVLKSLKTPPAKERFRSFLERKE